MVDQEPRSYRPRRAFVEAEPEPTPPPPPTVVRPAVTVPPSVAPRPALNGRGPVRNGRVPLPDFDDEDAPKPLYRDEYPAAPVQRDQPADPAPALTPPTNGSSPRTPSPAAPEAGSDDTAIRSFNFAPRPRRTGEDTTTILTRSGSTARGRQAPAGPGSPDEIDDYDDDEERSPIGERARWGLAIGVIAAVVVLGLAIGYAVLGLGDRDITAPAPSQTAGSVGPGPTTSTVDPAPTAAGALLTDDLMLSAGQAKRLDSGRTWKAALTQRGASEDTPLPACFGAEPVEGQPVSQQKILRVLSSNGKDAPSALHDATAYATPEEAVQAFAVAARTLGTCSAAGAWLSSGRLVRGVGDQAVGAVVPVLNGKSTVAHSVVISRTGRVLNVVDASRPGKTIDVGAAATALADVTKLQCGPAGGKCAGDVSVKGGPPPLGGDEPGFLAVGDLPPVGGSVSVWNAAPVVLPEEDFVGANCEQVNWTTTPAEARSARVYLLHPDAGTSYFGVNQIVITAKDTKTADALVQKIRKDLESCKDRRLTATVSKPEKVEGTGARDTKVTGYTSTIEQDLAQGSTKYRVGIVQAGTKVAYTFANPKGDFDFTDDQWDTIAVRAGERVTQVS